MDGWKLEAGKNLQTGIVHGQYMKKYGKKVFRLQVMSYFIFLQVKSFKKCLPSFISSPELLGSQGELIVYPSSRRPSVRRPSTIFKDVLL